MENNINKQLNKWMQGISGNACSIVPTYILFSRVYFNYLRT